jgi:hypothetical protein
MEGGGCQELHLHSCTLYITRVTCLLYKVDASKIHIVGRVCLKDVRVVDGFGANQRMSWWVTRQGRF